MAKRRKTRKDKIRADLREKLSLAKKPETNITTSHIPDNPLTPQAMYTLTMPFPEIRVSSIQRQSPQISISYIRNDLIKTSIVTAGIVIAQFVLFLTLT